jgi:uncharacterized protein (TIGR00661 family)
VLEKRGQLDVLLSGTQADLTIDYPIKYRLDGFSFIFGKKGSINLLKTLSKTNALKFINEVKSLPVEKYDLIINDFEPVSAWACYLKGKECIGLSHHSAVLSPKAPKLYNAFSQYLYKHYAPVSKEYGFHFERFDKNIFTPVIRKQIREAHVCDQGHYTVYLPAYGDAELYNFFSTFSNIKWQIFSKHNKSPFKLGNVQVMPLNNEAFIESMASSTGIVCGAGFETPSEALFMNKKLLVIPMTNQYEQLCNAEALKRMGVPVIKKLHDKYVSSIADWIQNGKVIHVNFPDITENVLNMIINTHLAKRPVVDYVWEEQSFAIGSVSPA